MSVVDRLAKLFGVTFLTPGAASAQLSADWYRAPFTDPSTSEVTVDNAYAVSPPIAVAISCIADDSATVPWEAYQRSATGPRRLTARRRSNETDRPLENHPIFEVFRNPNDNLRGRQLWVGSYVSKLLFGEFAWYYPDLVIPPGRTGSRALDSLAFDGELYLLDPRRLICEVKNDEIVWSLRNATGQPTKLDSTKLTVSKRYNPYTPLRGFSLIAPVLAEASGDRAAAEWNRRFFGDQAGVPSGLLKPNERGAEIKKEDRDDYLKRWNARHGSARRGVGLLPAGWDWVDLGVSQRDMDFRSLREYSREQILGMCGVPPFVAGVLDKANYANAREQKELYWQGTIFRFVSAVQDDLNYDFLPKVGLDGIELYAKWEVVKALLEDLKLLAETAKLFWFMGVPFAEINDRLDLGFDTAAIPSAKISYLPVSVAPWDERPKGLNGSADKPKPDAPAADDSAAEPADAADDAAEDEAEPADDEKVQPAAATFRAAALVAELKYEKALRRFYHAAQTEIIANLTGMQGWKYRQAVKAGTANVVPTLDLTESSRRFLASVPYGDAFRRGYASVGAAGAGASATVLDLEARERVTRLVAAVRQTLVDEVTTGVRSGEPDDVVTGRVKTIVREFQRRSGSTAAAEIGWAFSAARFDGLRLAGCAAVLWTVGSEPCRVPGHAPVGEVRTLGDRFSNGSRYPLDGSNAVEVERCHCALVPAQRRRTA